MFFKKDILHPLSNTLIQSKIENMIKEPRTYKLMFYRSF